MSSAYALRDCYRPPTKLREGNVFSRVCLFTRGRIQHVTTAHDAIGHSQVTYDTLDMFKLIHLGTPVPRPCPEQLAFNWNAFLLVIVFSVMLLLEADLIECELKSNAVYLHSSHQVNWAAMIMESQTWEVFDMVISCRDPGNCRAKKGRPSGTCLPSHTVHLSGFVCRPDQTCSLEDPPSPATEARMVGKRAIRFLLECFLVFTCVSVISHGFSECIRCFNCRLQQSEQRFKDK